MVSRQNCESYRVSKGMTQALEGMTIIYDVIEKCVFIGYKGKPSISQGPVPDTKQAIAEADDFVVRLARYAAIRRTLRPSRGRRPSRPQEDRASATFAAAPTLSHSPTRPSPVRHGCRSCNLRTKAMRRQLRSVLDKASQIG